MRLSLSLSFHSLSLCVSYCQSRGIFERKKALLVFEVLIYIPQQTSFCFGGRERIAEIDFCGGGRRKGIKNQEWKFALRVEPNLTSNTFSLAVSGIWLISLVVNHTRETGVTKGVNYWFQYHLLIVHLATESDYTSGVKEPVGLWLRHCHSWWIRWFEYASSIW